MKDNLIQYKTKYADRHNIYKINMTNGRYNPVQNNRYTFHDKNDRIYRVNINHDSIEGISNLSVNLTLPEIKGWGMVGFNEYFGFGLINKVSLLVNGTTIQSLSGSELLTAFQVYEKEHKKKVYDRLMMNDPSFRNYRRGYGSDYVIYPSTTIQVPISMFMDREVPFSCLRITKGSTITVELDLKPLKSVINYNKVFLEKSLDNIVENYSPILNISEYNTVSDTFGNRYIEQYEETFSKSGQNQYTTTKFKGITSLSCYVKSDQFSSGKSFVAYPLDNSKENLIKEYSKVILNDILSIGEMPRTYPDGSVVEEVKDGVVKFNSYTSCNIEILGIPEGMKLWYHKNILTFSRRNNDKVYNISEKFKRIRGQYYPLHDTIEFCDIDSSIGLMDVSIPNDFWKHEYNTSLGDLRSERGIKRDIYLNLPFVDGLDFLGENNGIETINIETGGAVLIDSNTQTVVPEISYPNGNSYITRFGASFNNNNLTFIEPSKLIAKPNENFERCSLIIKPVLFNENDIRNLINYDVYVGVNHVKKISYDGNELAITDV